ncbi:hypothetical protein AY599_06645 [Leptolyngbya valderiana BDU 20041]|nr:hypothetical protein AY599_06645 [Leptolyngbya valderiana BDU 20041]
MTHAQTIEAFLTTASGPICDDCLSAHTGITPRQTVNLNARRLERRKLAAKREAMLCAYCKDHKVCNRATGLTWRPAAASAPAKPLPDYWHWEGHVQDAIVEHLRAEGYDIRSAADTASKAAGKDIIAEKDGRALWISVKGFPAGTAKTNASSQSRHWFAKAVFDLVLYKDQEGDADLALGLPGGYKTYHALADRVTWLRTNLPFSIYWVAEDGSVRVE